MKKMKVESFTVESYDSYWPPEDAVGCVAWFQNLLEAVPQEYLHTAKIDIGNYKEYDDAYAQIRISYTRPETDAEEAERERRERAAEEAARNRELQLLAQLQAKYGEG